MAGTRARGSIVSMSDGVVQSAHNITGITVTNGVATFTALAHGGETGDIVTVAGETGMVNINREHIMEKVDDNSYRTHGGIMAEGAGFAGTVTGTIQHTPGATGWIRLADWKAINTTQRADRLDVSSGDTAGRGREYQPGFIEREFTLTLNYNPQVASHSIIGGIEYLWEAELERYYRIEYPQYNLTTAPMRAFPGLILTFDHNTDSEDIISVSAGGAIQRTVMVFPGVA